uniref:E2F-associated phosphoprotein n=1 Tax=Trichuris muris TaxID=70415 RepID=A0A5S6QS48_TRIMR
MDRLEPLEKDAYHYGYGSDEDDMPRSSARRRPANGFGYRDASYTISPFERAECAEFDKEMENELNSIYQPLASCSPRSPYSPADQADIDQLDPALNLNSQFTLSDEEFAEEQGLQTEQSDNLLYNPTDDEDNQKWIDNHRRSYQPRGSSAMPLPRSDAVLNCPACMALLCLDCQRHVQYSSQYRAMFVENCAVKFDESLTIKQITDKKKRRKGKWNKRANSPTAAADEMKNRFHPVVCQICGTEVAVFDSDGVYHFFNVLASYA